MTKQYKILVVDDNQDLLEITTEELRASNYEVITASNGLEALRKAERDHPDLIILDIMLPGLDGYEVCHRLRSKSRTADIPILMHSAKVRDVDRETGLRVGADDYLTKSVDSSADLVRRVEVLLIKKAEREAEARAKIAKEAAVDESVAEAKLAPDSKAEKQPIPSSGKPVPEAKEEKPPVSSGSDEAGSDDKQRSRLGPRPRL